MKYLIIVIAATVLFSCKKTATSNTEAQITACTQLKIDSALAQPKGALFEQINAYRYNGAVVYLYLAGCCDGFNILRDADCNYLFSPSGGFIGCGDCTHRNFFNEATFIATVWKDPR